MLRRSGWCFAVWISVIPRTLLWGYPRMVRPVHLHTDHRNYRNGDKTANRTQPPCRRDTRNPICLAGTIERYRASLSGLHLACGIGCCNRRARREKRKLRATSKEDCKCLPAVTARSANCRSARTKTKNIEAVELYSGAYPENAQRR